MTEMTEMQRRILKVIREHIVDQGEGPTIREIGRRAGLSSTSSVAYQLGRLEALGAISRSGSSWRTVRLG